MGRWELANHRTQTSMTQLCTVVNRTDWEMTNPKWKWGPKPGWWNLPCLCIMGDWVHFFFCWFANKSVTDDVGICWTSCPSGGNPVLLELLAFDFWKFPVRWHSIDIWEEFTMRIPLPSRLGCVCSHPNHIIQCLHANLKLTNQVINDLVSQAWFFGLLQNASSVS